MTNTYDKYIDNINILIYLFHIATITNDLELAKLVISKINIKNKDTILLFVKTKIISLNERCVLHFAAKAETAEMLKVLLKLVENNIPNLMICYRLSRQFES
eukprot:496817_1